MTINQLAHREFINSPLWKQIRAQAFEVHGNNCISCGSPATDIHHKTYVRFGGRELLSDLEPLCRSCHDSKHSVLKAFNRKPVKHKRPWLRAIVAYRYLTPKQRAFLIQKFNLRDEREMFLRFKGHRGLLLEARRILNVNIVECSKRVYRKMTSR